MLQAQAHAIESIQRALDDHADARTRRWRERALRGDVAVRGVKMASVRRVARTWNRSDGGAFSAAAKKELALALLREASTEDKLCGMLLLSDVLLPAGDLTLRDVPRLAALFRDGALADRTSCDRFCVNVLGPLVEREGPRCARTIADWRSSGSPWQRRAAGIAFLGLAKQGDDNFAGFTTLLLRVCDAALRHPDRRARAGAGRVLRELSRAEPGRVAEFVEKKLPRFSAEMLRQATANLPRSVAKALRDGRSRGSRRAPSARARG
jgi:hypothetical protein